MARQMRANMNLYNLVMFLWLTFLGWQLHWLSHDMEGAV